MDSESSNGTGAPSPSDPGPGATLLRLGAYTLVVVLTLGAIGVVYWQQTPRQTPDSEQPEQYTGFVGFLAALSDEDIEFLAENLARNALEAPDRGREAALPKPALNGFALSNATIPREAIRRGGPPRDGIPALLDPKFVPVSKTNFLRFDDKVVSVEHDDDVRAYPLRVLVWHEIVNDTVGGVPVAVTYCPLCGTAMVFDRRAGGRQRTFGVSGLLYNNDVLMYDHQTESLWSQLKMEAVSGPMVGTKLNWLPSRLMSWEAWRERYPNGKVLSTETGYARNYASQPYEGYDADQRTLFPFDRNRDDLDNKTWVVGVRIGDAATAYALETLAQAEGNAVSDSVGGVPLRITYRPNADEVVVVRADNGEEVPGVRAYWFAWQAFYPDTDLYRGDAPAS